MAISWKVKTERAFRATVARMDGRIDTHVDGRTGATILVAKSNRKRATLGAFNTRQRRGGFKV